MKSAQNRRDNMSLNLVTAHTGTAHITAEQVASLIKGAISDDTANLYRFQTGHKCEYQITDALQVQILTGDAVFNGRHFIVEETETIDIDPASLNYARIDGVFLEIYSDNDTSEEQIRFEIVQGNEYLISTGTPTYPATPTGIDDSHTLMYVFPWLYITTSYTTISTVEDNSTLYPSLLGMVDDISGINNDISGINTDIANMQETFQDGVDSIYNAIVAEGVTPSSSTPTACATGIATVADNQYTSGYDSGSAAGYINGYDAGYAAGYAAGSSAEIGSISFSMSYSTMPSGLSIYTALSGLSKITITNSSGLIGGDTMCTVSFRRASGAPISTISVTDAASTELSFPANTGRVAITPSSAYSYAFGVKFE